MFILLICIISTFAKEPGFVYFRFVIAICNYDHHFYMATISIVAAALLKHEYE